MKQKLLIGTSWILASKLIVNILAMISTVVLARFLAPDDFGLVAIVVAVMSIFQVVTDLSIAAALIHLKKPTDAHYDTAWTLGLIRGVFLGLSFFLIEDYLTSFYDDLRLKNIIHVLSVSIFVSGLSNPKLAAMSRELIFWQEFVVAVSQKLIAFTISVTLAIILKSYWALIGGLVAAQLTYVIVSYLIFPYKPKLTLKHLPDIWSFSIWLTLGRVVSTVNWKFDHLLVGGQLGNSVLGLYTVGDNLAGLPTREAIQPLEKTLFPGFTKISDDQSRLKSAYIKSQTLITMVALPLGVGFAFTSEPLIMLFMGEKWLPAAIVIQVIACVYGFQSIGNQVVPIAMTLGQTKSLFYRDLIIFVIRIPIIILFMKLWGLIGIVFARVISGSLSLLINMTLIKRVLSLNLFEQLNVNIRAISSSLLMAVYLLLIINYYGYEDSVGVLTLKVLLYVLTGGLVYMILTLSLWKMMGKPEGPEQELLKLISAMFKRFTYSSRKQIF